MGETILKMQGIQKYFSGVHALKGVDFELRAGEVHALMGENGAGKSTLMKCLFGIYSADGGEIYLDGRRVSFKNPKEALESGVAMVHQELNQALKRSVSDNIWLGRYPRALGFITRESVMRKKTLEIFEDLGIEVDPDTVMSKMSVSERQMVEIAKAVSYNSKIIVLDEPTSSLNDREVEHLFRIIEKLRARGCGIIYISHKMEEILRISDDVTVMRDGRHVATERAADMTMDKIIKLMVGRELTERFPPKNNKIGEVALEVKDLSARYAPISGVSFSVRSGEIVGVAGLGGSGRTELLESIFGLCEKKEGEVRLHGHRVENRTPGEAKKNGFALLTEERRADGIFGILDITDNTVVSGLSKYRLAGLFLSEKKMKKDTEWSIKSLRIKTPSRTTKIRTLSGGNQQKVILGRWLLTEPEILLLDEPTRGIDVGAKYEIYQLIISLAEAGKCVMMVSSEMPELLGVCDRILVMSGGRLAGELDAKQATQEKIMELASRFA